jgi:hypothetical protein
MIMNYLVRFSFVFFLLLSVRTHAQEPFLYASSTVHNGKHYIYVRSKNDRQIYQVKWEAGIPKVEIVKELKDVQALYHNSDMGLATNPLVLSKGKTTTLLNIDDLDSPLAVFDIHIASSTFAPDTENYSEIEHISINDINGNARFLQKKDSTWTEAALIPSSHSSSKVKTLGKGLLVAEDKNGVNTLLHWTPAERMFLPVTLPTNISVHNLYRLDDTLIAYSPESDDSYIFCRVNMRSCDLDGTFPQNSTIIRYTTSRNLFFRAPNDSAMRLFVKTNEDWQDASLVMPEIALDKRPNILIDTDYLFRFALGYYEVDQEWQYNKSKVFTLFKQQDGSWTSLNEQLVGKPIFYRLKASNDATLMAGQAVFSQSFSKREAQWTFYSNVKDKWYSSLPPGLDTKLRKLWDVKFIGNSVIGLQDFADSNNDKELYEWHWFIKAGDKWEEITANEIFSQNIFNNIDYDEQKQEMTVTDESLVASFYLKSREATPRWVKVL